MAAKKKGTTPDDTFTAMLLKAGENDLATLAEDETLSNTTDWIDTGCLALNGLITADIFKGIPNNKVIALAGEEATGKTFIALQVARQAINKGYLVAYFDSENAVEKEGFLKMGVNPKKVLYFPVDTVEDFRDQAVRIVNEYNKQDEDKKPKLLFILDSLGGLSTRKEIADIESGNDKKDMTRAPVIKSVFRVLNKKMALAKIPMLITNHVYENQGGYIPEKVMSGGSGLKYAASIVIFLAKSKLKDEEKTVSGLVLTATSWKNRFCRPYNKVKLNLDFSHGLHKYYGLQGDKKTDKAQSLTNFCEPMLTKDSISGESWTLNGEKIKTSQLINDESIWSKELLELAAKNLHAEFAFGENEAIPEVEEDEQD